MENDEEDDEAEGEDCKKQHQEENKDVEMNADT